MRLVVCFSVLGLLTATLLPEIVFASTPKIPIADGKYAATPADCEQRMGDDYTISHGGTGISDDGNTYDCSVVSFVQGHLVAKCITGMGGHDMGNTDYMMSVTRKGLVVNGKLYKKCQVSR